MIEINLNGQKRIVEEGTTVLELIEGLKLSPKAVIIEYNCKVIKTDEASHLSVADGDKLELIQIVGGG